MQKFHVNSVSAPRAEFVKLNRITTREPPLPLDIAGKHHGGLIVPSIRARSLMAYCRVLWSLRRDIGFAVQNAKHWGATLTDRPVAAVHDSAGLQNAHYAHWKTEFENRKAYVQRALNANRKIKTADLAQMSLYKSFIHHEWWDASKQRDR